LETTPEVYEAARDRHDPERTECGDASACLSVETHSVDAGRLRTLELQDACRTGTPRARQRSHVSLS